MLDISMRENTIIQICKSQKMSVQKLAIKVCGKQRSERTKAKELNEANLQWIFYNCFYLKCLSIGGLNVFKNKSVIKPVLEQKLTSF